MDKNRSICILAVFLVLFSCILLSSAFGAPEKKEEKPAWQIHFNPSIRFGTDDRVLYMFDWLVPLYKGEKHLLFSNIKHTLSDKGGWEVNLGAGDRYMFLDDRLILGLNTFYDWRETDWGTHHRQWGAGAEAMAEIPLDSYDIGVTGRFNYYHPLSGAKFYGAGTPYANYLLVNSGIEFLNGRVEEPMQGFDYEAGVRIPLLSDCVETWAYAGGYHYLGNYVEDINGFMARLEIIPADFVRLSYEFRHDNVRGDEYYGEVSFIIPFSIGNFVDGKNPFEGIGSQFGGKRKLKQRMIEPVRRDVDIRIAVEDEKDNFPGASELVENVVFVSETGSDVTGDGTMENPYATNTYALSNDSRILSGSCRTIHVMNTSVTATIDDAATLNGANFFLWGSGVNHPVYNVPNMPFSGHPTLTDTLTLDAQNPKVMGLEFQVHDRTAGGDEHGIVIANGAGGSGIVVSNNIFDISDTGGNNAYGILADVTGSLGTAISPVIISQNPMTVTANSGEAYGIKLEATEDIFARITDNDMSNTIHGDDNAVGIYMRSNSGSLGSSASPLIISQNPMAVTSDNSAALGIYLRAGQDIYSSITDNDMSGAIHGYDFAFGISLNAVNGGIGSETAPLIISQNPMAVTSDNFEALGIYLRAGQDVFGSITDNDMSGTIHGDIALGLYMLSGNDIGSATSPLIISHNPMTVTANSGEAYGVRLETDQDIFASVSENILNITAGDEAYGGWFTAGNLIGNNTTATFFTWNSGAVNGTNARYLLWLNPGAPGNSNLTMGAGVQGYGTNTFPVPTGGWSGNYGVDNSVHDESGAGGSYIWP